MLHNECPSPLMRAPLSGSRFSDYSGYSNLLFTGVFLSLRAESFLGEEEMLECASHEQVVHSTLGFLIGTVLKGECDIW